MTWTTKSNLLPPKLQTTLKESIENAIIQYTFSHTLSVQLYIIYLGQYNCKNSF